MKEVEITQIDLKYNGLRLKNPKAELELLASISETGIQNPVFGIEGDRFILIDGFKRVRCANKLGIRLIPCSGTNSNEAMGLIHFLKNNQMRNITFIEEATLIDVLNRNHGLSGAEISRHLGKSQAWVSIRLGVLSSIPESVKNEILSGRFPYRAYLYVLRPFTRVKDIPKKELESFVQSVSGKSLSVKTIEQLAKSYFYGSAEFKEQIRNGNLEWTLEHIKSPLKASPFNETEKKVLQELQHTDSLIQKVPFSLRDKRLSQETFFIQAVIWVENILKKMQGFAESVQEFYDKRRSA